MWWTLKGGWNASSSFCTIGSYGVSSGAQMATSTTSASSTRPANSVWLRPIFCSRMVKLSCSAGWPIRGCSPASSTLSLIRHPWIEKRIRQIDHQIDDDHQDGADDRDRLYHRVVAAGNGRKQ